MDNNTENNTPKFNIGDTVWVAKGTAREGVICLQAKIANLLYIYNGECFNFEGYILANGKNNESCKPRAVHATKEELIEYINNSGQIEIWKAAIAARDSEESNNGISVIAGKIDANSKAGEVLGALVEAIEKSTNNE